jgi:RNA polymerase sigma-70 factor (ECF subfamily)
VRDDRAPATGAFGASSTDLPPSAGLPTGLSISFEDFYEIEEAGLFGALTLIMGNRHEAEDLKQEAFLKVWERWDLVQSMANPTGYLYRTAMNGFRGRLRRARLAARKLIDPRHDRDAFEGVETRSDFQRALASLTPRQRVAVVLTELLEFSTSEAADTLGVKPATIRKFVSTARESLRSSMRADDG